MRTTLLCAVACVVLGAGPALAADVPASIRNAVRCAPRATVDPEPIDIPRILGTQEPSARALYAERDLLIVGGGTTRGIAIGQQFFTRRATPFGVGRQTGPRAISTTGWLRIVAANETTSIGVVERACGGIERGDFLEPYAEPALPENIDRTDTTGTLDFDKPAHVLFGDRHRLSGGAGDFMIIDAGVGRGAEPGARFAIYRDLRVDGVPLAPVGEAIVVLSDANTAVIRLTSTRDVVRQGDLVIPRK